MSEGNYQFEVIHESVASDDLFPDKTHKKVADTLFDLIMTTDVGVTIGLEGGWGSGKSTVVSFLDGKLTENCDDTLFYSFDAWAHEGDPLRRIFLENLIDTIDLDQSDNFLVSLRNKISGRKKTVSVDTKKTTSKLGGWISFSAIFVPVGAAILSALDYNKILMPWNAWEQSPHLPFSIGLFLTLAPLWILIFWSLFGESDSSGKRKWDLFSSDSVEKFTQDITEDGERTSIEFEKFFNEIMAHCIGSERSFSRAIFVIDNLDRVEPKQTLLLWSILQTFFQHRSTRTSNELWRSKIWFLIPYDREGLTKIWNESIDVTEAHDSDLTTIDFQTSKKDQNQTLAHSFLDKSFQIIAEVPEPVMSAWVDYCERNIRDALVGWPREEVVEVTDTFKRFESRLDSSPTPRQIHSFINRVGILGMRWGGEMTAEAIALYALLRKDRSDKELRKSLLLKGFPDGYESASDQTNLKEQLAGMLFGVASEKGIQLLLEPEIKSALHDGDPERIGLLINTHGEAFWIAWESIHGSSLPSGHVEEYRITVTTAFCLGVKDHKEKATISINNLIAEWKKTGEKWELDRLDYSEALRALLDIAVIKASLLHWLKQRVLTHIRGTVSNIDADNFNPHILPNLSKLIDLLKEYKIEIQTEEFRKLDHSNWQKWLETSDSQNVEIKSVLPAKGILNSIAQSLNTVSPDKNTIKVLIHTLGYIPNIVEWKSVVDQLVIWISNPQRDKNRADIYSLLLKIYLKGDKESKEKIKKELEDPGFIQTVEQEEERKLGHLHVLFSAIHEKELLSANIPQLVKNYWISEFDIEVNNSLIEILKQSGSLWLVWLLATDSNNKIAVEIIRNQDLNLDSQIYSSECGAKYLDEFEWASDEDLERIVKKLIEYGGLSKAKSILIENPLLYRHCLKIIKQFGGNDGSIIVKDALKKISAQDWSETLSQDSVLFECIDEKGDHEFKDGFVTITRDELKSGKLSPHIWGNIDKFFEKLMDRDDISNILADAYFEVENDPLPDESFEKFGSIIIESLSRVNSEHVATRIEKWLVGSQWDRIKWLLGTNFVFDGVPTESLSSRVSDLIVDIENSGTKEIINSLVHSFHLKIDRNSDSSNENNDA